MSNFVELLDVYDDNGVKTGKVVKRGIKDSSLNDGEHIAVAIIYIENDNKSQKEPDSDLRHGIQSLPEGGFC